MNMKKIYFLILAVAALSFTSCGILAEAEQADLEMAKELVANALNHQELAIEVDQILPQRGPAIHSTDGYTLTIKDGVVDGFLPFFGESYTSIVYGVDETGLKFDKCPIVIDDSQSRPSKGKYVWRFAARVGMEKVYVTVTFFENGSADIMCNPTNRSIMNYNGDLVVIKEKK